MKHILLIPFLAIFLWMCLYDANFDKGLVKTDVYLHSCTFYFADGTQLKSNCKDSLTLKNR